MIRVHQNKELQFCKQQQITSGNKTCIMCLCLMVGPLTMKLGTLMYHDKSSSNLNLQVCKQQQTASGNKNLKGVCAYKLLVLGPLTMKLGTLQHDKS